MDMALPGNMSPTGCLVLPRPAESSVYLPEDQPLRRGLLQPDVPRPFHFLATYEDRCLFYDCYRSHDGKKIILQGPGMIDLEPHFKSARFATADGKALRPGFHSSRQVNFITLDAATDVSKIQFQFADMSFRIAVQPNHSDWFAGDNLLVTLSKDNDLRWIEDWVRFYVNEHGATALAFFDNQSTAYTLDKLEDRLATIPGLKKLMVMSVPHKYGRHDKSVTNRQFWCHFLQPSVLTRAVRRFGMQARALLNVDIDELLIRADNAPSAFDEAASDHDGLAHFPDRKISGYAPVNFPDLRHADFIYRDVHFVDKALPLCKWALAPRRWWVHRYDIHYRAHYINRWRWFGPRISKATYMAHFHAISTSWKEQRTPQSDALEPGYEVDTQLVAALRRAGIARRDG